MTVDPLLQFSTSPSASAPAPVITPAPAPAATPSPASSVASTPAGGSLYYVKGDIEALKNDLRKLFTDAYSACKNPHASLIALKIEKGIHGLFGTAEAKEEQHIPGDD